MMETIRPRNNTVDMFYGFWKYLGVMGSFFIGLAFFWWGIYLFQNQWIAFRLEAGFLGNILLMPMVVGLVITWMSFAEFFRIIRIEE